MPAHIKIRGPQVRPNNLPEYLDNFRAACAFLVDAQDNHDDGAQFYQLWAEAGQHARTAFHRGCLTWDFVKERERDILTELWIQPQTYIDGMRVYAAYRAGLIHNKLAQLSMEVE